MRLGKKRLKIKLIPGIFLAVQYVHPTLPPPQDASISVHIENICSRNYVHVDSGRRLVPTKLGIVLVHGYQKVRSGVGREGGRDEGGRRRRGKGGQEGEEG